MSEISEQHYDSAIQFLQSGQVPQALASIEEFLTEDGEDPMAWRLYSLILTALRRPEDAAKASARADELGGDDVDSILMKAAVAAVEGRHAVAITLYEKALEADESRFDVWLNYALVLIQEDYNKDALDASERAVTLKPDSAQVWYTRGRILRLCGESEAALQAFEKSLAIESGLAVAWYERGMVYSALERQEEAMANYQQVLELRPGDPAAAQAIEITRLHLGQA